MLSGKRPRCNGADQTDLSDGRFDVLNFRLVLKAVAVLSMAVAGPAAAHHSFALYDMTKTLSAKAVIKDFHWGAPHSSASFVIKEGSGPGRVLTLQGAAPGRMKRAGFDPKDMRRGMNVEITWHPLRNGEGGSLMAIKFPDGRTFKDDEYDFTRENPAAPPGDPAATTP
jgi:Family of unknown function (DUF6152)